MSEVVKQYTIKGALGFAAASLIYMLWDQVTPELLVMAVVILAYTLLCWVFGSVVVERYKRKRYAQDDWNQPQVKTDIRLKAASFSAAPLAILLSFHYPGATPLKMALIVVYSIAAGGALPWVRDFLVDHLWPMAKRWFKASRGQ